MKGLGTRDGGMKRLGTMGTVRDEGTGDCRDERTGTVRDEGTVGMAVVFVVCLGIEGRVGQCSTGS